MRAAPALAALLVASVMPVVAAGDATAAAIAISDCRQAVPDHGAGVVTSDIECTYRCDGNPVSLCDPEEPTDCPDAGTCTLDGIVLGKGATLYLDGHEIVATGKYLIPISCGVHQQVPGHCRVLGPGNVVGWGSPAITGGQMNLTVRGLDASSIESGAVVTLARLVLKDVRVSSVEGNIAGVRGVRARDVVVRHGGIASAGTIAVKNVELQEDGGIADVVAGRFVRGSNLTFGPVSSIRARGVSLDGLTAVRDPGLYGPMIGVVAERGLHLRHSVVQGYPQADLQSGRAPRLVDTICGKSLQSDGIGTWGVCADD